MAWYTKGQLSQQHRISFFRTMSVFCFYFLTLILGLLTNTRAQQLEIPCSEFHPRFNIPCMCGLNEINATRINCDKAVFTEFPVLPYRFYIQEFSQRYSGLQTLGAQLFTASDLPLTRVDFSHNSLMRLTDRLFDGVEDTLEEISFGHNRLGDTLNPVFTSGEFENLKFLRHLDLSYNLLNNIEEGLLKGCVQLKVSHLKQSQIIQIIQISLLLILHIYTL